MKEKTLLFFACTLLSFSFSLIFLTNLLNLNITVDPGGAIIYAEEAKATIKESDLLPAVKKLLHPQQAYAINTKLEGEIERLNNHLALLEDQINKLNEFQRFLYENDNFEKSKAILAFSLSAFFSAFFLKALLKLLTGI